MKSMKMNVTPEDKKVLWRLFLRSFFIFMSFNMVKMQGQGFLFTFWPVLGDLYKDDPEGFTEARLRHCAFYNTHACADGFIVGLTYAMEKEKVEKGEIEAKTISSIKVALMGPFAGIFDSIFFNAIRVIAAGIAIGLSSQGNFLGVILFIIIYGFSFLILRWYMVTWGYAAGVSFIDEMFKSGMMKSVTKAASILGLVIVGGMVAQMVVVPVDWTIYIGDAYLEIMPVFDAILPGILSIALLFGVVGLLRKKVSPVWIVLGILVVSILFGAIGIF